MIFWRGPDIPGRPEREWKARKHRKKRFWGKLGRLSVEKIRRLVILRRSLVDLG